MVLEVNAIGQLVLPPELVRAAPRTRIEVERQGEALVLKPVADPPPRPSILDLPTFSGVPGDQNGTFRREEIYGDAWR